MKEIQRGSLFTDNRVMTTNGIIEGTSEPDFLASQLKGIPFAAPPVGELGGSRRNRSQTGRGCAKPTSLARGPCNCPSLAI